MVIILRFLWLSDMGLICFLTDQILGICWLSHKHIGSFFWKSLTLLFLLEILVVDGLFFIIWAYLVAQYIVDLQRSCVSLCHLLEEQVLYILSTWFIIAIICFKRQVYVL